MLSKVTVHYYILSNGTNPVKEFLDSLPKP